jgi:hypothetical protein
MEGDRILAPVNQSQSHGGREREGEQGSYYLREGGRERGESNLKLDLEEGLLVELVKQLLELDAIDNKA